MKDNKFFELLEQELIKYGRVKITGLGVFRLKKMKEHSRYIPGSRKIGKIKAHVKISFTPTNSLKVKMQKYHGK